MRILSETTAARLLRVVVVLVFLTGIGNVVGSANICSDPIPAGIRVYSEHVQYPFLFGFISGGLLGIPWKDGFGVWRESESVISVPGSVYSYVCQASYGIFRRAQWVGWGVMLMFLFLVSPYLRKGGAKRMKREVYLLIVTVVALCVSCSSSKLPASSSLRGPGHYDALVGGYSMMKYYDEAVGYYVAEVREHSDIAHIRPSKQNIYGILNVKRPLHTDPSLFVLISDEALGDFPARHGTVILASGGGDRKSDASPDVGKKDVGDKKEREEEKPLSERIKAVKKAKGAGSTPAAKHKEQVLFHQILHGREGEEAALTLEALKTAIAEKDREKGVVVRIIGHGDKDDKVEEWMGEWERKAKEAGFSGVEMFLLPRDGNGKAYVEIMVVKRE